MDTGLGCPGQLEALCEKAQPHKHCPVDNQGLCISQPKLGRVSSGVDGEVLQCQEVVSQTPESWPPAS